MLHLDLSRQILHALLKRHLEILLLPRRRRDAVDRLGLATIGHVTDGRASRHLALVLQDLRVLLSLLSELLLAMALALELLQPELLLEVLELLALLPIPQLLQLQQLRLLLLLLEEMNLLLLLMLLLLETRRLCVLGVHPRRRGPIVAVLRREVSLVGRASQVSLGIKLLLGRRLVL